MVALFRNSVAGRFFGMFFVLSLIWLVFFVASISLFSSPILDHRQRLQLDVWHLELKQEILKRAESGSFNRDLPGESPPVPFALDGDRQISVSLDQLVEVPEGVTYRMQSTPEVESNEQAASSVIRLPFCQSYLVSSVDADYRDSFLKDSAIRSRARLLVFSFAFTILVASFVAATLVTRPLRRLQEGAQKIAGGDLHFRVHAGDQTEIGALAGDFNEMAERLQERERELIRASELKTRFLAVISHELRTPLTSIHGYGRLLLDELHGPLNADQIDALQTIERNSEALMGLIDDLLDISRIEADRLKVDITPVTAQDVVAEALQTVSLVASKKGINIVTEAPEEIVLLDADPGRLRQVILNLVNNAIKFTREGEVVVRIREDHAIEVTDTGPGIEQKFIDKIFQPFYQVESYQKREHGGAGLGLAISQRLVKLMGGTLEVESELGKGTTFRVILTKS